MQAKPIEAQTDTNAVARTDGRVARDMYLIEVKKPSVSTGEWDAANIIATVDKAV